jgi:hypothetical protein
VQSDNNTTEKRHDMAKKSSNTTKRNVQYYTAYLVTNNRNDSFLNTRVYSGRIPGTWGPIAAAHIFRSERQAQSCAGNINRRNDAGFPFARVIPISMERSAPRR